jgi:hypothetical protein
MSLGSAVWLTLLMAVVLPFERSDMNALEIVVVAIVACGLVLFLGMLPDIRRYLRIRSM